jgi:hypothetical protein
MKPAILSAALAIAFVATGAANATPYGRSVSAQDKPNFAGKWKSAGSFNTWTITVEGIRMTITMTVAGNSESNEYLLDGTPSKKQFEGPNGPAENVSTSTWEGDVLVTTIKTAFGTILTEKRWIEPDGTMGVQTSLEIPGKPSPPPGPGMVLKKIG